MNVVFVTDAQLVTNEIPQLGERYVSSSVADIQLQIRKRREELRLFAGCLRRRTGHSSTSTNAEKSNSGCICNYTASQVRSHSYLGTRPDRSRLRARADDALTGQGWQPRSITAVAYDVATAATAISPVFTGHAGVRNRVACQPRAQAISIFHARNAIPRARQTVASTAGARAFYVSVTGQAYVAITTMLAF